MQNISLRYATDDDAVFLFKLKNEPECRRNSLNSAVIVFEDHIKWLSELLSSDAKKQYILMDGDKPVGQGRLERLEEGCRLSYSIIPERRGCGYGKILLKLLNNAVLEVFPSCRYIYGEVLRHNLVSQRIFEELGYELKESGKVYYYTKSVGYCAITELDGAATLFPANSNPDSPGYDRYKKN